jgi:hypothetical protein
MKVLSLIVVGTLLLVAGCEKFFYVNGLVVDSNTNQPISGATATLVLDKGVEEPNQTHITGSDGGFCISFNEHAFAWATLTVDRPGYQAWSTQFCGAPQNPFVIRLKHEQECVEQKQ